MNNVRTCFKAVLGLAFAIAIAATGTVSWAANLPEVDKGLAWLNAQVSASGSLRSEDASVATPLQSRAESYLTLKLLASPGSPLLDAVAADTETNTEFLARKALAKAAAGADATALAAQLRARQNADGGIGTHEGFPSNALDTAWALIALKATGAPADAGVAAALDYLGSSLDGGACTLFGQPSIYVSALCLRALGQWGAVASVATPIQSLAAYLMAQRGADGAWDNSPLLTALAYEALHDFQAAEPLAGAVRAYLIGKQSADGSWNGDPFVTALALRALAATTVPPSNPASGTVRGTVRDALTNLAIGGATATLTGPATYTANSNGAGQFALGNLAPGQYTLELSKSDYGPLTTTVSVAAGAVVDLGALTLSKSTGATTGTVRGTVVDMVTRLPIEGVAVTVGTGPLTATTDATGTYQISSVPTGAVTLYAAKTGYATAQATVTIVAGGVVAFSPQLAADAGGPAGTATLRGFITDRASGLPVAGVVVRVQGYSWNRTATTDASGNYVITNIPAETGVALTATKSGYDTFSISNDFARDTSYIFSPRMYATGKTPPGGFYPGLTGVVVDAATGQPVAGAVVKATIAAGTARVTTGTDGRFTFSGYYAVATAIVEVSSADYLPVPSLVVTLPLTDITDIGQIRLRKFNQVDLLPDLKLVSASRTGAVTDPQSLMVSGSVTAKVVNKGVAMEARPVQLLAFADVNRDGAFTPGTDTVLGKTTVTLALATDASASVAIPVEGQLAFRDAPISIWVDSAQSVVERDENNNVRSTADGAQIQPDPAAFKPVVKWQWTAGESIATPIVGPLLDTNGDGKVDDKDTPVVIVNHLLGIDKAGGYLRALSGKDGHELWNAISLRTDSEAMPALGDIDGDGKPEVVFLQATGGLVALNGNGTVKWITNDVPPRPPGSYLSGGISLADIDGDGKAEILTQNYVINHDGTLRFKINAGGYDSFGGTWLVPLVADLDGDGKPEIIVGNTAVHADGSPYWSNPAVPTLCRGAIGSFDNSGKPSIVCTYRGAMYMINANGTLKWGPVYYGGGYYGSGLPTIGDFDGDGIADIGAMSMQYFWVYNADGSLKWKQPIFDGSDGTGATAFDFDGDGRPEIVYFDEQKLRVFDGAKGNIVFETPNISATSTEYPVVADVDGDGHADLLVISNLGGKGYGLRVFQDQNNAWVRTRKIWNEYNYRVTNVNDDGSIPRHEENSWQVHNTYRANLQPHYAGSAIPDLSASYVRIQDRGGQAPSTVTVRIGNAGGYPVAAGVKVAFYKDAVGTLIGTALTSRSLLPGEYEDVSLSITGSLAGIGRFVIVADDNGAGVNAVEDFDRGNNSVSLAFTAFPASLSVSATIDAASYGANGTVKIDARIANSGSIAAAVKTRFSIETADGLATVATLPATVTVSVGSLASVSVPTTWNTGGTYVGNYRVKVELLGSDERPFAAAYAPFAIVAAGGVQVEAKLSTNKITYPPLDTVALQGRVQNRYANQLLSGLIAKLAIIAADGSELWAATAGLPSLVPGALKDLAYNVPLASAAPGSYLAKLDVVDASSTLVVSSRTTFTVQSSGDTGAGLRGTVAADPWRANVGATIALAATVANAGNAPVNLPASFTIVNPVDGTLVAQLPLSLAVAVGAQQSLSANWVTSGTLAAGTYVAALTAEAAGRQLLLGQDVVVLGAAAPFAFAPVVDAIPGSTQTSAAIVVAGLAVPSAISIAGGEYSINGGAFTSQPGMVANGDQVRVRLVASSGYGVKTSAVLTIGAHSAAFDVTTIAADQTPDAFAFDAQTGAVAGAAVTSNTVTITGVSPAAPISVAGGEYRIDDGPFTNAPGTIAAGSKLTLRMLAPSAPGATATMTVTVGTFAAAFQVSTAATVPDTTPEAFAFDAVAAAAPATAVTSNTVTIRGINTAAPIAIVGGEYRINGGAFTSASGTVNAGDMVNVRLTSAASAGAKVTATLTVGGVSAAFDVTTRAADTTPDAFTFPAKTDQPRDAWVESDTVVVSGIDTAVAVHVNGGEYRVNGGAFTALDGTIQAGDRLTVRVRTANAYHATASMTVGVGGYATSFSATTVNSVAPTLAAQFTSRSRVLVLVSCTVNGTIGGAGDGLDDPFCVMSRQRFIDEYLTSLGIPHAVVTTGDAFRDKLRCGDYNTYWIAGGAAKLRDQLAEEVREAVLRGDGLIVDGRHDARAQVFDDAAGITANGSVTTNAGPITFTGAWGTGSLAMSGDGLGIATTGTVQARFANGQPAIASGSYGLGKAAFFAYDFLASLKAAPTDAARRALLEAALAHVRPAVPANWARGGLATATFTVTAGAAGIVELQVGVPAGASMAEANPSATTAAADKLAWRFDLAAGETRIVTLDVRLPAITASGTVLATLHRVDGAALTEVARESLAFATVAGDDLKAPLVADLNALSLGSADLAARDQAVQLIGSGYTKANQNRVREAVADYLAADRELEKIVHPDTTAYQVRIARLMQDAGKLGCAAASAANSCPVATWGPAGYNVLAFGSARMTYSDTRGAVAVGGNLDMIDYSVASRLEGDAALLAVGGNLGFTRGGVGRDGSGLIRVAGSTTIDQSVVRRDLQTGPTENFAGLKNWYTQLSDNLAALGGIPAATDGYGKYTMTGTDPVRNVFTIRGTDLDAAWGLDIVVPETSTVIVNVTGATAGFTNGADAWRGQTATDAQASRVLYNFPAATAITVTGWAPQGSLLAPRALLDHQNAAINGQVIADRITATGDFRCGGMFAGSLPITAMPLP